MPYDAAAIDMRKLTRDATRKVPRAISPLQKIRHERQCVGRFVGRNVGRYFLAKIRILPAFSISSEDCLGKLLGDGAGERNRTLVFSLEVENFATGARAIPTFCSLPVIEITREFLFVGMATTIQASAFAADAAVDLYATGSGSGSLSPINAYWLLRRSQEEQ
jgi:hypothetical protein